MYTYKPKGVCSQLMKVSLDDNNIIESIDIIGGCPGNLIGISKLCVGRKADEVIETLKGIRCGLKKTSCPDQLATALKNALAEKNKTDIAI